MHFFPEEFFFEVVAAQNMGVQSAFRPIERGGAEEREGKERKKTLPIARAVNQ